jgi:hypothetical protein
MNAYLVVSETLHERIPILNDGSGPDEPYCIVEIVVAEGRSQAKWAAWRTDRNTFPGRPSDMPKFSVRRLAQGVAGSARLATDEPEYQDLWTGAMADDPECLKGEIEQLRRERDWLVDAMIRVAAGRCTIALPDGLPDGLAGREFDTKAAAVDAIGRAVGLLFLVEIEPEPATSR